MADLRPSDLAMLELPLDQVKAQDITGLYAYFHHLPRDSGPPIRIVVNHLSSNLPPRPCWLWLGDAGTRDRLARWRCRDWIPGAATAPMLHHDSGDRAWILGGVAFDVNVDPDDPRRLPDGCRFADALALKLIVLHPQVVFHG